PASNAEKRAMELEGLTTEEEGHPGGRGWERREGEGKVRPQLHLLLASWCERAQRASEQGLPAAPIARSVPIEVVRLTPGSPFYEAQQINSEYLLQLSLKRLLWSFYLTAGLPTQGEPYGGWEEAERGGWPDPQTPTRTLRGHFVGHYLSGLSLAYSSSGDRRLLERAEALVRELERCQQAPP
ncbi:MAG: hypothetical protein SGPRY_011706, partial [Prymnesium sp.]